MIAGQMVVIVSRREMLDCHKRIEACSTGILRAGNGKTDGYGIPAVKGGVFANPSVDQVVAFAAFQRVFTVVPRQDIVGTIAQNRVVACPTDRILDQGTRIVLEQQHIEDIGAGMTAIRSTAEIGELRLGEDRPFARLETYSQIGRVG
jgi:hypothetical protein